MAIKKKERVRNGSKETYYVVTASTYDKFGKRIQRKKHARNKAQARDLERELIRELHKVKQHGPDKTFADFLPTYFEYSENKRKKTKGTVASEKASLNNHALPILGSLRISDITSAHIENIIEDVLQNHSTQTKKHCFNYLNAFFKLALRRGFCNENPCNGVERIKVNHRAKVILNYEQLQKFLEATQEFFPEWFPHFMTVIHCAFRASEARGLQWGDIDWKSDLIYLHRSFTIKDGIKPTLKNGQPRTVPMSPELTELLSKLKEKCNPKEEDWVLERHPEFMRNEQAKVVRDICRIAGIPQSTFHQLRAAAITNFFRHDVPIGKIMKIAGHKKLSSTNIYYDNAGEVVKESLNHISFLNIDTERTEEET